MDVWNATFIPSNKGPILSDTARIFSPPKVASPIDKPKKVPKIPRPVSVPGILEL